ncbi:alpha/beta hydrolase [Larkinella insperata]|uniref:Alpha/beta hydrolase n=1 Tax=Larkinella insperata TaxID=332158 RepID=A0ABW3Q0E1_9BACT|nr:alpha/beta hydrolase [Larkinella insperata]
MKRFTPFLLWLQKSGMNWKLFSKHTHPFLAYLLVVALLDSLSSCLRDHDITPPPETPTDWMAKLDPQMKEVIDELTLLNPTPLWQLSVEEARKKPTVKDAVLSLLAKKGQQPPMPNVTTSEITVPGSGATQVRAVVYKPANAAGMLPVIVYYHGGGWVLASPEVYESSAKALAEKVGALVVSVDYHLSPENKFATAHVDCYKAYEWVLNNAASIGGDASRIAVAGESAGGNMSVGVCMMARNNGIALPKHQLLVYPVANNDLNTPSYIDYANAKPLDKPLIEWFVDKYFKTPADGDTPWISLVDVADLSGLPPATIIAAEIDPLQTEGKLLYEKFLSVGVKAKYEFYAGTTHEFFGTNAVVQKAEQAQNFAAAELKEALK